MLYEQYGWKVDSTGSIQIDWETVDIQQSLIGHLRGCKYKKGGCGCKDSCRNPYNMPASMPTIESSTATTGAVPAVPAVTTMNEHESELNADLIDPTEEPGQFSTDLDLEEEESDIELTSLYEYDSEDYDEYL